MHFSKYSQSQLTRGHSAISKALPAGVFPFFSPPLFHTRPSYLSVPVAFVIVAVINVAIGRAFVLKKMPAG